MPELDEASSAAGLPVLGIGELLWDLLPSGARLGGAPFNVVAHLRRFGHPASYLTAVGDDELGRAALAEVAELGVDALAGIVAAPTGTVGVRLDRRGIPEFDIRSPAAYELAAADATALAAVAARPPRAVVFGTLAQRHPSVRAATAAVLDAARAALGPARMCVYDVNLRPGVWSADLVAELAALSSLLKLNDEEVATLAPPFGLPPEPLEAFAEAAAGRFGLDAVCVTLGADGALVWRDGEAVRHGGYRVEVADTVGAGDAFTAALVHGLLTGAGTAAATELAAALGALVASRPGAIPPWTRAELDALAGASSRPS